MISVQNSLFLAGISRRSRLLVVALMVFGILVAVAHSETVRVTDPAAGAAGYMLSGPDDPAAPPRTTLATPTATCPGQTSCHHGQILLGFVTDTADGLIPRGYRRLVPGPVFATGRRAGLDHPPPIA